MSRDDLTGDFLVNHLHILLQSEKPKDTRATTTIVWGVTEAQKAHSIHDGDKGLTTAGGTMI